MFSIFDNRSIDSANICKQSQKLSEIVLNFANSFALSNFYGAGLRINLNQILISADYYKLN